MSSKNKSMKKSRKNKSMKKPKKNKSMKNKSMKKPMKKPIKKNGYFFFADYPEFKPNLSPREMFKLGSFGGTYWRPIKSSILGKNLKNIHKKYPWWKGIPENHLSQSTYDKKINKYGVKVGTSLEFWEGKGWIKKLHPYGWVHWYCDFFSGKRCIDDERQIKRWKGLAGHRGRFMRFLVTQILKKGTKNDWNNSEISPKIRQVLQHWGYKLTKKDFNNEIKRRKL
jgi:hypothetical protein